MYFFPIYVRKVKKKDHFVKSEKKIFSENKKGKLTFNIHIKQNVVLVTGSVDANIIYVLLNWN